MLLTKSCHDIDWLVYLFGRLPVRVASFGSLTHFRTADRPEGAADRCLDCPVEPSCPYSGQAPLPPGARRPGTALLAAGCGRCRTHRGGGTARATHRPVRPLRVRL